jgi:hypothetical protein
MTKDKNLQFIITAERLKTQGFLKGAPFYLESFFILITSSIHTAYIRGCCLSTSTKKDRIITCKYGHERHYRYTNKSACSVLSPTTSDLHVVGLSGNDLNVLSRDRNCLSGLVSVII